MGKRSFTPTKRGWGAEKALAMLKGRGWGEKTFWGSFLRKLEVLAIQKGEEGRIKFPKGVHNNLGGESGGGGAQKVLDPRFSHFVAPPLPPLRNY